VPLSRHRKIFPNKPVVSWFKSFDNTFIACEAVTWMLEKLKEEQKNGQNLLLLGGEITREKIVLLLDKFLAAGVFQAVNGDNNDNNGKKKKKRRFKDDRTVYRYQIIGVVIALFFDVSYCSVARLTEDEDDDAAESDDDKENSSTVEYSEEVVITPLSVDQVRVLWEETYRGR